MKGESREREIHHPPPTRLAPQMTGGKKVQNETDTDGGRERDTQRERHRHTNLEIDAETHRERECGHVPQTAGSRWESKTPGQRCAGRDRNRRRDLRTDIETHAWRKQQREARTERKRQTPMHTCKERPS